MHIPERLIRLAKQRALAGFSALTEKTVSEADALLSKAAQIGTTEQRGIPAARGLLRTDGGRLRIRMGEHYATYLDRALQTMHRDLRTGLHNINADNLTLIDDDVVMRQMEVDRLVLRLRDADSMSLGRINLTIAQLHGENEVRERENPFRPYLLARSLHDAVREFAPEETLQKLLFDSLSQAMATQLSGFYSAILEVFESGGLSSRLMARPSAMTRAQRDSMAWQRAAEQLRERVDQSQVTLDNPNHGTQLRMLPKLKRLMDMQAGDAGGGVRGVQRQQAHELQDLVWEVFKQPKLAKFPRLGGGESGTAAEPRSLLDMQLMQMQRAAARDLALDDPAIPVPQPLDLREKITDTAATQQTKVTMDLVSLLFESIVNDDHVPEAVRKQLGRLQVPFLRAAVLDPSMLHEAGHPARRLLDRIGSVAASVPETSPEFAALQTEIGKALGTVLERFDGDPAVFADAEQEIDDYLSRRLPEDDPTLALCAQAITEAEAAATRLSDTVAALVALLEPLHVDQRVFAFVTGTWARVLAYPSPQASVQRQLLPELLWSAQQKTSPEERSVLMRMLPDLVRKVREGLLMIGMKEAESKSALDLLVAVHMDVLGNKQFPAVRHMSLDQFSKRFEQFEPGKAPEGAAPGTQVEVSRAALEAALSRRGVAATLVTDAATSPPTANELEWLAMARAGAGFELMLDSRFAPARLSVVAPRRGVFLFSLGEKTTPVIFVRSALLEAMRSGALQSAEYAPVFERAVESLLAGADSLST